MEIGRRIFVAVAAEHENELGIHLLIGFQGLTPEEELTFFIREFRIGGIVLFRRNIESVEQLQALLDDAQACAQEILGRRLWVAIDQEGGPVQRLVPPLTHLPSARELALEGPRMLAEWTARGASDLRRLGIQNNLAPVLDVVSEGRSHFMEERSLGTDPQKVAELGCLWVRTLQENGISATAKHYPGLGQSDLDPHHFAPVIRWENEAAVSRDLLPFQEAIRAGVHCVMTSHALYPYWDAEWPATLSPVINREWLRHRLGFTGALLSDDMDMAAVSQNYSWEEVVRQGLRSSIDFFLLCQNSENIEPFYATLREVAGRDSALKEMRSQSVERIRHLFNKQESFPEGMV